MLAVWSGADGLVFYEVSIDLLHYKNGSDFFYDLLKPIPTYTEGPHIFEKNVIALINTNQHFQNLKNKSMQASVRSNIPYFKSSRWMALVLIRFSTVGGKVQKVVFITSFIAQFFALKNQCAVVTNVDGRRDIERERHVFSVVGTQRCTRCNALKKSQSIILTNYTT